MWPEILREVRALVPARLSGREPGLQSLGYREALACSQEELPVEQGLQRLIRATLAYAKRQRTWFKNQIAITQIIAGGSTDQMLKQSREALKKYEAATC